MYLLIMTLLFNLEWIIPIITCRAEGSVFNITNQFIGYYASCVYIWMHVCMCIRYVFRVASVRTSIVKIVLVIIAMTIALILSVLIRHCVSRLNEAEDDINRIVKVIMG